MRFLSSLIAMAMIFAFATESTAQQDKKGAKKRGDRVQRTQRGNVVDLLKRMDANEDSLIQREEVPERFQARFDRMDTDDNGVIDAKELKQIAKRMREMARGNGEKGAAGDSRKRKGKGDAKGKRKANDRKGKDGSDQGSEGKGKSKKKAGEQDRKVTPEMLLRRFDKDGDQKLAKAEVPERLQKAWDRLDKDGDGFLDGKELRTLQRLARDRGDRKGKGKKKDGVGESDKEGTGSGVKPKRPGSGR